MWWDWGWESWCGLPVAVRLFISHGLEQKEGLWQVLTRSLGFLGTNVVRIRAGGVRGCHFYEDPLLGSSFLTLPFAVLVVPQFCHSPRASVICSFIKYWTSPRARLCARPGDGKQTRKKWPCCPHCLEGSWQQFSCTHQKTGTAKKREKGTKGIYKRVADL